MTPTPTTGGASTDTILLDVYNVIVEPLIILLITVALVVFVWGMIEFIAGAGNEEKKRQGQKHMMWGVLGVLVMVSVFGIVNLIANTLDVDVPIELD